MPTTAVVTLGHDGLIPGPLRARTCVEAILLGHEASVLATFHDGTGQWTTEDGSTLPERCDAWIVSISLGQIDHLTTALGHLAKRLGQDALGLIVHGAQYGPSYVVASA